MEKEKKSEWRITANDNMLFKYRINDKDELEYRTYKCEWEDAYWRITYFDTGMTYTTKDYMVSKSQIYFNL